MGCSVAVIGVSACSERSSGFLHEDHPYEQDKASEARAGEKNSSRAVDAFVLCVVPAAVLVLCSLCRTAVPQFFDTSLTLSSRTWFCQHCRNPCCEVPRM